MLTRLSLALVGLMGLLPFVSPIKLPPVPSFWAEWIASVLAVGWLMSLRRQNVTPQLGISPPLVAVPVVVLAFAAFAGALLLQLMVRQPMFRGAPVLALLSLVLAMLVSQAGARVRAAGEIPRLLDAWAIALLVALVLNLVAVMGDREGLHLYVYQLGTRPPPDRAEGLLGQPNQLAVFAGLAMVGAHYLWMRGKLSALGHVLVSLSAGIVIAASASRAGALLWAFTAILAAMALRGDPRRREGWSLLLVGVVLFVAAQLAWKLLVAPSAAGAMILRNDTLGRIELLRDSWALIQRHPLDGVGYGNFMASRWTELSTSLFEPSANHAHNIVAQVCVELGLVGGVLVLVPLCLALWNCLRVATRRGVAPEHSMAAVTALAVAGYSLVEFPLWYAFFLLPFALMLGLVPQRDLRISITRVPRPGQWLAAMLAWLFCGLLAFDYQRSEELYSSVDLQQRRQKLAAVRIPLREANEIAGLSAFDVYANLMYSRALAPDGFFMEYKLEIADKAMLSMTNQETVARKIALLVVAGDLDSARELLNRTHRSRDLERDTREFLDRLAPLHPALRAFVREHPALPDGRIANNPPALPR